MGLSVLYIVKLKGQGWREGYQVTVRKKTDSANQNFVKGGIKRDCTAKHFRENGIPGGLNFTCVQLNQPWPNAAPGATCGPSSDFCGPCPFARPTCVCTALYVNAYVCGTLNGVWRRLSDVRSALRGHWGGVENPVTVNACGTRSGN